EGYYANNPVMDLKLYVEKAASFRIFSHFILQAERVLKLVQLNSQDTEDKGKFLEVGCGPGILLDIAQFDGWESVGLEPSQEGAAWGRQNLGLSIIQGRLEKNPPISDANIVVASEVIEHILFPEDFSK